ncbi:HAD family hydrolase [Phragmitibacter flavus]|uniref:HAD family hydrolase n=1 Tax=Phragmitibacter flavus TaxID=2576071 RepID=UPI00140C9197|nr:HAD family hydrolase [Phragmitibacter flavus]
MHFSLHGLIRGQEMELGRDPDTGGQCLYVLELVKALSRHPDVRRVTLVTRRVSDPKVSTDYAKPHEDLGHGAEIRRIDGGPKLYRRKEVLWRHLDAMIDNTLAWLRRERRMPDLIHAHYGDAGYVGRQVAAVLGCPFVFTGHSLGRVKRMKLMESGMDGAEIEKRYNLNVRIESEEMSLDAASFVVTSTHQEIEEQYAMYDQYAADRMRVIPPGVDLSRFDGEGDAEVVASVAAKLERFLLDPQKPAVLAIARADERKNLAGLVRAFGGNEWLRENANLVIVGGNRKLIEDLAPGPRKVWMELLRLIDDCDLRGNVAIPKTHGAAEVAGFFRWAAERGGVFVNPAFTEPFGLTLLEASAAGLPLVATHDGGPRDILANCENGVLVDPFDPVAIGKAIEGILSEPTHQAALAAQGAKAVREFYGWSSHVNRYLREMRKVLPMMNLPVVPVVERVGLAECERWIVMDLPSALEGESEEMMGRLRGVFEDGTIELGIATGMSYERAMGMIERLGMPLPSFVVSRLGARIDYPRPGAVARDEVWQRQISVNWRREEVVKVLEGLHGLELQPEAEQDALKVSFYRDDRSGPRRLEVQRKLREAGIAAKVLVTAGRYLDVVPVRSGKDVALRYLMHKWGMDASSILYFATLGSDAAVMRGRMLAVVAGNSDPQLEILTERVRLRYSEQTGLAGLFEGIEAYGFLEGKKPPGPDDTLSSDHETVSVEELLP